VTLASAGADGIIIGSKLVGMIEENLHNKEKMLNDISSFLTGIRIALEQASC
jgi:tryptophan synthase alpha subunit